MLMTAGQFLRSLEEFSILPEAELLAIREQVAASGGDASDAQSPATRLVAEGKLTPFQVKGIYRGKARRLICGEYVLQERLAAGASARPIAPGIAGWILSPASR